jgi:hypothetical protein
VTYKLILNILHSWELSQEDEISKLCVTQLTSHCVSLRSNYCYFPQHSLQWGLLLLRLERPCQFSDDSNFIHALKLSLLRAYSAKCPSL